MSLSLIRYDIVTDYCNWIQLLHVGVAAWLRKASWNTFNTFHQRLYRTHIQFHMTWWISHSDCIRYVIRYSK